MHSSRYFCGTGSDEMSAIRKKPPSPATGTCGPHTGRQRWARSGGGRGGGVAGAATGVAEERGEAGGARRRGQALLVPGGGVRRRCQAAGPGGTGARRLVVIAALGRGVRTMPARMTAFSRMALLRRYMSVSQS